MTELHSDKPGEGEAAGPAARANVKRERKAPRRSATVIRSDASMLGKEARKILAKHRARIDAAVVVELEASLVEIERLIRERPESYLVELELQSELLDELLHQHASFARKSALRDTLENIGIAVIVALAVRSCIYEPFKIPSGSMMPTLRAGDHIFVNKFAYGVQVPLTTRIVAKDWISTIERGDVIVFRYPLDETDDFIKRVIGLPGDTIRVNSDRRKIEIKRAGEQRFVELERHLLEDVKCQAETSTQPIENCAVFSETLDGHTYQVRYRDDHRTSDPSMRTFEVPEDHLLVMGDNRNASHDSLAWTVTGSSVSAAGLLSRADIRDLTPVENDRIELHDDGDLIRSNDDALRDQVRYLAERSDAARGLVLEAFRAPPIDARAVFESVAARYGATEVTDFASLTAKMRGADARVLEYGAKLGAMRFAKTETHSELVFWAPGTSDIVFRLHCGTRRCIRDSEVATRAAMVVKSFEANPDFDARELLSFEYGRAKTFPGRGQIENRYLERRFGAEGQGVRLRAWRAPHEGLDILRDAALAEFGAGPLAEAMRDNHGESEPRWATVGEAAAVPDLGAEAWVLEHQGSFVVVHAEAQTEMLAVLECGPRRCKSKADAVELATLVASRFPIVAKERERLPELLGQGDVGGLPEAPIEQPGAYYWDHLSIDGVVLDDTHSVHIDVEQLPAGGLEQALASRREALPGAEPVEGLGPAAYYADTPNGHTFVFSVPQTDLVVQLACRAGLCPDREVARALAERARDKGQDPENFVQEGMRARPFVPRGNVKGRAEVIWWPNSRFWKKID